jgi:hypothetical protein
MARLPFTISTEGLIAVPETTADTMLQIRAPTNQRVVLKAFHVWIETLNVDEQLVAGRVLFQTTDGTGSTVTERKKDGSHAETVQATGFKTFTAEPTIGDIVRAFRVGPLGYSYAWPEGDEPILGGGDRIGIDLLAFKASVTAEVEMELEE